MSRNKLMEQIRAVKEIKKLSDAGLSVDEIVAKVNYSEAFVRKLAEGLAKTKEQAQ